MAHKSGLQVDQDLKDLFARAQEDTSIGYLKIVIDDEAFRLAEKGPVSLDIATDLQTVEKLLTKDMPCYIILRMSQPHKWLLVSYVTDNSKVRDKMLYASSRAGLKDDLGSALFVDDFFVSEKSECNMATYEHRTQELDETAVMTMDERIKHEEAFNSAPTDVKSQAMASLPFQATDSAMKAFEDIKNGSRNVMFFNVDLKTQALSAEQQPVGSVEEIQKSLGKSPVYLLFNFEHNHDNAVTVSPVYIYYCPDSANKMERMIYATCKRMFIEACDKLDINLGRRLEISEPSEVNSKDLLEELYPKKEEKKAFAKPSRPGKGKARMRSPGR